MGAEHAFDIRDLFAFEIPCNRQASTFRGPVWDDLQCLARPRRASCDEDGLSRFPQIGLEWVMAQPRCTCVAWEPMLNGRWSSMASYDLQLRMERRREGRGMAAAPRQRQRDHVDDTMSRQRKRGACMGRFVSGMKPRDASGRVSRPIESSEGLWLCAGRGHGRGPAEGGGMICDAPPCPRVKGQHRGQAGSRRTCQ